MINEDPLTKKDSPPLYESDNTPGHVYLPGKTGGGGYDALPTYDNQEGDDVDLEASHPGEEVKISQSTKNVQYAQFIDSSRSVQALVKYLKKVTTDPHDLALWALKINILKKDSTEWSTYSIRLPDPLPGATFFALPNDSPCLRGGPNSLDFEKGWRLGHQEGMAVLDDQGSVTSASLDTILEARARWDSGVSPPWISVGSSGEDAANPAKTVEAVLRHVGRPEGTTRKDLVCSRVIHGWDRDAIQASLADAVKERLGSEAKTVSAFTQPKPHFLVLARAPCLAVSSDENVHWVLLGLGMIICLLLLIIWPFWVCLILALMPITFCIVVSLVSSGHHVHDGVGFAWAMKSWTSTGLPASYSREEVVAELTLHAAPPSLPPSDYVVDCSNVTTPAPYHLRRTTRGWDVLNGRREGDWLSPRLEHIVDLIEKGQVGDLTEKVESAIRQKEALERRRLRRLEEEDESLGL